MEAYLVEFVGLHRDSIDWQLVRPDLVELVQSYLGVEERVRRPALRLPGRLNTTRLEIEGVAAVGFVRADPEVGVLIHLVLRMNKEPTEGNRWERGQRGRG